MENRCLDIYHRESYIISLRVAQFRMFFNSVSLEDPVILCIILIQFLSQLSQKLRAKKKQFFLSEALSRHLAFLTPWRWTRPRGNRQMGNRPRWGGLLLSVRGRPRSNNSCPAWRPTYNTYSSSDQAVFPEASDLTGLPTKGKWCVSSPSKLFTWAAKTTGSSHPSLDSYCSWEANKSELEAFSCLEK